MKTKLSLILIAIFMLTLKSYGQFSFGVSPGLALNSTYFGYKINSKVLPFIGFQYAHAKFKSVETGQEFDYDLNQVVDFSDEVKFSGSLYVPTIGLKYFAIQHNKIQGYFLLCIAKPLLGGKLEYDEEVDDEFDEQVKNISLWGSELGFGMEYFFDDNFSLGGEFGLRYIHAKYKDSYDDTFYNPITGDTQDTEITETFKYTVNPTYSKISLNFYF